MKPRTLLQRCQGARAVAIEALVRKGEANAAKIVKEFGRYALRQTEELAGLARKSLADRKDDGAWRGFIHALRDVRSSSATAGAPWIESYARHLHDELVQRERFDPHLPTLVELYLDAMKVAASGQADEEMLKRLNHNLALAMEKLKPHA